MKAFRQIVPELGTRSTLGRTATGTKPKKGFGLLAGPKQTLVTGRRSSEFDPLRTILRLGHVADGAIVPTANDGRNRFGKFSAPVGSKSRKRTSFE
jgi:hypothetical protein